MVLIPAGTLVIGFEHGDTDEKPAHSVTLGPFFIDKFEVTQKDFEKVMGFNPSIFISGTFTGGYLRPGESSKDLAKFKGYDRPVERVSWHEAKEYCLGNRKAVAHRGGVGVRGPCRKYNKILLG